MNQLTENLKNLTTENINVNNKQCDILFILGSGASVDSGLPTYRGPTGIYKDEFDPEKYFSNLNINNDIDKVWDYFRPLLKASINATPGPTYNIMKKIIDKFPKSAIITQNVDGLAYKMIDNIPLVEIHGNNRRMKCMHKKCEKIHDININKPFCECGYWCRPDITCYGEMLDIKKMTDCYKVSKKFYKYVIVIGTTIQFSYLKEFLNNAKRRFAKVIHINPDDSYEYHIKKNERWIKETAFNGLTQFYDEIINDTNQL